MQAEVKNVAPQGAGASGGAWQQNPPIHVAQARSIKNVVADIITALEESGLHGVWAVFAETPDAVVMHREFGFEIILAGRFVKIRVTTDEEFNVKYIDVEYE
jgi:hypothetical protein